jgi:uncharacterized membrane protein
LISRFNNGKHSAPGIALISAFCLLALLIAFVNLPAQVNGNDSGAESQADNDSSFLESVGAFHPVSVHFPIALLVMALVSEILAAISGNRSFSAAGLKMSILSFPLALISMVLGLAAGTGTSFPPPLDSYLIWHRNLGILLVVISFAVASLAHAVERQPHPIRRRFYLLTLTGGAVLVAVTSWYGAVLVYGPDHFPF